LNAYNQCTAYNKTIMRLERVLKFVASNLSQGESSNLDCRKCAFYAKYDKEDRPSHMCLFATVFVLDEPISINTF